MSACLTSEQVAAFIDRGLPRHERKRVRAHMADCDKCRRWVSTLVGATESARRRAQAERQAGRRRDLRRVAGLLIPLWFICIGDVIRLAAVDRMAADPRWWVLLLIGYVVIVFALFVAVHHGRKEAFHDMRTVAKREVEQFVASAVHQGIAAELHQRMTTPRCTRAAGHDGPCNGLPCESAARRNGGVHR